MTKTKKYTMDQLDHSLSDYRLYKDKLKRLDSELIVLKGKIQEVNKQIEDAAYSLNKEKRKIHSIIEDLDKDDFKSSS
jgi:hypothetical protein